MVTVVGLEAGHYEVHRTDYATSYVWCPGRVTVECGCGERLEFVDPQGAECSCGRDHSRTVRGGMESLGSGEETLWSSESSDVPGHSEKSYESELSEVDIVAEED